MPGINLKLVEEANRHPLNQAALKALRKAKVPVADHLLYALQLADWGTEESGGNLEVPYEVSNLVHLLYGEDPRVGMKYLTRLPGEDEEFDPSAQVKEGGDPADLAWAILDHLWSRRTIETGLKPY